MTECFKELMLTIYWRKFGMSDLPSMPLLMDDMDGWSSEKIFERIKTLVTDATKASKTFSF